jgi:hypothetical protein
MPRLPAQPPSPTIAAQCALGRFNPEPTEAERISAVETVRPGGAGLLPEGCAQPWAPQPSEDAQEYAAFLMWAYSETPCPTHKLAKKWAWALRKEAWHEQVGNVPLGTPKEQDAQTLRAVQMVKSIVMSDLSKHLLRLRENYPTMTVQEGAKTLKDMVLLERLIGGLSTERVEVNYDNLSDEDLAQLVAIQAKTLMTQGGIGPR